MSTLDLMRRCRVLPVVTVNDVEETVRLTRTLLEGGMPAVEITLRTAPALEAIRVVKAEVPDALVAAGTVTNPDQMQAAAEAGADFAVSPGISADVLVAAAELGMTFIPGVATPSEVMLGLNHGMDCFKLFPAEAVGGMALLKALAGPFPEAKFCPTGGLNPNNFRDYLALPNVGCVGGSWMVASSLVDGGRWDEIRALAEEAMR